MAYLSRSFGPTGDDEQRRLAASNPLAAGGDAGATEGAPLAPGQAAAASPSPSSQPVDHNAIRSFFEANKDQGASVLGGLADSLSNRIRSAPGEMSQVPGLSDAPHHYFKNDVMLTGGVNVPFQTFDLSKALSDQQAKHDASVKSAQDAAAQNVSTLGGLSTDVGQLGTMEGQQNLLAQRAGPDYSAGQGRLDSWLSGSATNRASTPAVINNVNAGLSAVKDNAGIWDPSTQKKKSMEDYLNGR